MMTTTQEFHVEPFSTEKGQQGRMTVARAQCKVRKPGPRRSLRLELKRVVHSLQAPMIEGMATSSSRTNTTVKKVVAKPRPQRLQEYVTSESTVIQRHQLSPVRDTTVEERSAADVCSSMCTLSSECPLVDSEDETDAGTEVEVYPVPSTTQEKEARRLARQKQLREMQVRDLAESRKMRLLRRQGVLAQEPATKRRRVVWAEQDKLVRIHVYSPVPELAS